MLDIPYFGFELVLLNGLLTENRRGEGGKSDRPEWAATGGPT
jgi:hypothetical protein